MNDARDLTVVLRSRFPLVAIETHEEARATDLLERICNLEEWAFFTWSVTAGLRRHGYSEIVPSTADFGAALRHIEKTQQNGIYLLLDAHPFLEDPVIRRLIREIALGYHKTARTLVFVSPQIELPTELTRLAARFTLSLDVVAVFRAEIRGGGRVVGAPGGKQGDGPAARLQSSRAAPGRPQPGGRAAPCA